MSRPYAFLVVLELIIIPAFAQPAADPVATATASLRAGRYGEAHQVLKTQLEQGGSDPRLWTLDGYALVKMDHAPDALKSYQQALRIAPDYLPALEGAAEVAFKSRTPEAADLLRRVSSLQPADQTSHAMLATLSFEHGDCKTAEAEFEKGTQAIANQPASLAQRAACLVRLERAGDAVAIFQELAKQSPEDRRAQYNLALSQLQAGQTQNAIETIKGMHETARDTETLDLLPRRTKEPAIRRQL